jgi:hypothetical protein
MWKTDQLGLATWQHDAAIWHLDARGGPAGIGVIAADPAATDAFACPGRFFSLSPVDQDALPAAGEQFVRGDQLHVTYPQGDGIYELRVAYRPVQSNAHQLVLETTIAVQTDRLDTHPKVDIDVLCAEIDSLVPTDTSGDDEVEASGSAPISLGISKSHCVTVLLGPHDSPFTTNHSTDSLLRLRLFGDFLEKGVIRKARPWLVLTRGGASPPEAELEGLWKRLCESPLPLTA